MNVDPNADVPEDPEFIDEVRVEEQSSSPKVDVRSGISEFEKAEKDLKGIIDNVCFYTLIFCLFFF